MTGERNGDDLLDPPGDDHDGPGEPEEEVRQGGPDKEPGPIGESGTAPEGSGPAAPPARRGWLLVGIAAAGIGVAVVAAAFVLGDWIEGRIARQDRDASGAGETAAPVLQMAEDMREVLLFFPRTDRSMLGAEHATVFDLDSPTARARLILERLLEGPESEDLVGAIPEGTALRELWISPSGTAFIDFSADLGRRHPGGTTAEMNTVFAVVNTLVYNLPEVRRVQILMAGREVDTLSGHLALWLPLGADLSLVDAKPRDEGPAPDPPAAASLAPARP
jgi:hypothetical protein